MPRRRLIGAIGALLASVVSGGCGSSSPPASKPAATVTPQASPTVAARAPAIAVAQKPLEAKPAAAASRTVVLRVIPDGATITADDPGVQLLLRQQSADGTASDLTRKAAWQVDPPGSATIGPGGYLRPLAAGKVVVKATIEGELATAQIQVESRAAVPGILPATWFPS